MYLKVSFLRTMRQTLDSCLSTSRSFSGRTQKSQYTCGRCGVGGRKTKALLKTDRMGLLRSFKIARLHPGKLSSMSTTYKTCLNPCALVVLWNASVTHFLVHTTRGTTLNVSWMTPDCCPLTQPPQSFLYSLIAAWELTQAWAIWSHGRTVSVPGWRNLQCWRWTTLSLCWSLPPPPPTTGHTFTTCTTAWRTFCHRPLPMELPSSLPP